MYTNGIEVMKQLHNNSLVGDNCVLIIDELQEWTINIEILVAWTHARINKGWNSKLVLMTANDKNDAITKFFNASSLKVPGR